jgi:hypothetical protein
MLEKRNSLYFSLSSGNWPAQRGFGSGWTLYEERVHNVPFGETVCPQHEVAALAG